MNINERKTIAFPVKGIDRDTFDHFRTSGMGHTLEVDDEELAVRQLGALRVAVQQVKLVGNYQEFRHWLADFSPMLVLLRGIAEGDAAENAATLEVLMEGTVSTKEVVVEKVANAPDDYLDMGYVTPEGSEGEIVLGQMDHLRYYVGYECGGVKEHYVLDGTRLAIIQNMPFKV